MRPGAKPRPGHQLPRRSAPFLAVIVVGFAVVLLPGGGVDTSALLAAGALSLAIVAAVVFVPWARVPAAFELGPPLGYLAVVFLLDLGHGGASAGYLPLAVLPILWLGLHGTRAQLMVGLAGLAAFFGARFALLEPPESEWRRAVLWLAVGTVIGLATHRSVGRARTAASEADALARELRESEERVRLIIDRAQDAFISIDGGGTITDWNAQAEKTFGWSRDEAVGRPLAETIIPERHRAAHAQGLARFLASGESKVLDRRLELSGLRRDGTEFPVELTISAVRSTDGWSFHSFVHDISERREAEHARLHAESIIESSADAIISTTFDRVILSWNEGATRLYGYSAEEALGKRLSFVMPPEQPDDVPELLERVRRGDRIEGYETTRMHRDGRRLAVSLTLSPIYDRDGTVRAVSAIARDIGERQRLVESLRKQSEALEVANRDLEAFSYSVSHDLRAPLRSIAGFGEALLEDYGPVLDARGRDYLERVRAASRRMGELIEDLLDLARLSRLEPREEQVDLGALAREVAEDLRATEPQRDVTVRIEDGLVARCDPQLARILVENLVGNAWKFTSRREAAAIEVGARVNGTGRFFYVQDNGAGFDPAYAERLFLPFQRLHRADEFEGTGIGLATVQKVVVLHGGRIWADGGPERGATFFFTLGDERSNGAQ